MSKCAAKRCLGKDESVLISVYRDAGGAMTTKYLETQVHSFITQRLLKSCYVLQEFLYPVVSSMLSLLRMWVQSLVVEIKILQAMQYGQTEK